MQIPDKRFFDYEFTELRLLRLTTPLTGGAPLVINQRAYFGADARLQGKRITGIDVMANPNNTTFYNDVEILQSGITQSFMLTLVTRDGEEIVKNFPCKDLHRFETFGNIRVFNCAIDIEKCYVIQTNQNFAPGRPLGMLFNFYTVST